MALYFNLVLYLMTKVKLMKKSVVSILMILITCTMYNCVSKNSLGAYTLMRLNEREFEEIKSISIEDDYGFRFMKTELKENKFNEIITSTETHVISDEEYKKVRAILKKY